MVHAMESAKTVLVSDSEAAAPVISKLGLGNRPVAAYTSWKELAGEQSFSSIPVLVLHFHRPPKGIMLIAIARLAHEYPGMQKVAVMDGPLPLPFAGYLTACRVHLIWAGPEREKLDQLASVVDRMHERTQWVAGIGG